jgi:ribosome biogenesis GTPase
LPPGHALHYTARIVERTHNPSSSWIVAQVHGASVVLWDGHAFQDAMLGGQIKAATDPRHMNAIAVGDEVDVEPSGSGPLRVISRRERRTHLERAANDPRSRVQIIAANATRALIVSSLRDPPFRPGLVDRWALLARRGGMEPWLCLNKVDLGSQTEAERAVAEAAIPLTAHFLSATTGWGLNELRDAIAGDSTVMVGHSGVGKSSILRLLVPGADASTGDVSAKNKKGRHTTSSSRLYPLPGGGVVIDTPGVRSVPLGRAEVGEVVSVFAEIADAPPCRFRTCTHRTEPGCSVLQGLEAGSVPRPIYARYRRLLEEAEVR